MSTASTICKPLQLIFNYSLQTRKFPKIWKSAIVYGICGNLLHWFENYLSDRNQNVVLQNCFSEVGNVKGGVPQGSVLGPLLFILYINDTTEDIQSLSRSFADDTSLSYSSSNINEIEQRLNSDIKKIYNWSTNG